MDMIVTCFYCGAKKELQIGTPVKLTCDRCSSARVILSSTAHFRCNLCGKKFSLPAREQVLAYHEDNGCLGRSFVLLDYE